MRSYDINGRMKAKMLNINYEEYKQLKEDFFGEDEEKKQKAFEKMTILMKDASEKINKIMKGKENV